MAPGKPPGNEKAGVFPISGNSRSKSPAPPTSTATANQLKGLLDILLQGAKQDASTPAEIKQALPASCSAMTE
jgi:hypothetical protein